MKLEVNLADRADVDAAYALLALIVDRPPTATTIAHEDRPDVGAEPNPFAESPASLPAGVMPVLAPSTAVATQCSTVPVGLPPLSLPGATPTATALPALTPAAGAPALGASAAPGSHAAAVETDKRGLPWDERIHSGGENRLNADGTWRKKRGLNDPALIARVEAELLARMGAPAATATAIAPALPALTHQAAPPLPVLPVAGGDPTTFEALMQRVSNLMTSGVLEPAALQNACASIGLPNVIMLQVDPSKVPAALAALRQLYPHAVAQGL